LMRPLILFVSMRWEPVFAQTMDKARNTRLRHAGPDPAFSHGASAPWKESYAIKDLIVLDPGSSPG